MGGRTSDRVGESAPDEPIEALYSMDVRMNAVDGVVYVCAVVLSDLYIVNKSKTLREVSRISERKKEGSVCRARGSVPTADRLP